MKEGDWLTTRQFAEQVGRPYDTVIYWLRKGLVEGAKLVQVGSLRAYQVPQSAVAQFKKEGPRRGRPPKAKPQLRAGEEATGPAKPRRKSKAKSER